MPFSETISTPDHYSVTMTHNANNSTGSVVSPSGETLGMIYVENVLMADGNIGRWDVYVIASWTDRHFGTAYEIGERDDLIRGGFRYVGMLPD